MTTPSINDHYLGVEMSTPNADKFAILFIEPNAIKEDLETYNTKWWDYRDLHGAKATMFFYHTYMQIVPQYLTRHVGTREGQSWQRMAMTRDLRKQNTAVIRAFWKARMAADTIGCPYDVYVRAALKHFYANYNLYATAQDGTQMVPYPNQLASGAIIRRAQEEWDAERKTDFRYPQVDPAVVKDHWYFADMEHAMHLNAGRTEFGDYYIREATKRGFITQPV